MCLDRSSSGHPIPIPACRWSARCDVMRCDALARRGQSIPDSPACNCSNRRRPVERGEASIGRPASQPCPETVSLTVPVPVAVPHLGISNRSVRARSRPESIFRSLRPHGHGRPIGRVARTVLLLAARSRTRCMHGRARARAPSAAARDGARSGGSIRAGQGVVGRWISAARAAGPPVRAMGARAGSQFDRSLPAVWDRRDTGAWTPGRRGCIIACGSVQRRRAGGRRRRRRVCVDALCRGRSGPGQGGAGEIGGGGGHWPCGGGGARWEPKPKASPQRQQGA